MTEWRVRIDSSPRVDYSFLCKKLNIIHIKSSACFFVLQFTLLALESFNPTKRSFFERFVEKKELNSVKKKAKTRQYRV